MARIRTIKPAFFRSATVANLPTISARITWIGLWTYADDEGRGTDDARLVKADIWPLDDKVTAKVVETHLAALAGLSLICRYEDHAKHYFHVVNWREHQKINHPQPSVLPHCTIPEHSRNDPGTIPELSIQEGNGREVEGEGNRNGTGMEEEKELLLTSSSTLTLDVNKPVDDDDPDRELRKLAEGDLFDRERAKGPVYDRTAWLRAGIERRRTMQTSPTTPATIDIRIDCAMCEGAGMVLDDDGYAYRCEHTSVTA